MRLSVRIGPVLAIGLTVVFGGVYAVAQDDDACLACHAEPAMFEDVETGDEIYVDPGAMRESYLQRFRAHLKAVDEICDRLGVTCRRLQTDEPLELALSEFLRRRMRVRATPGRRVS